MNQLDKIYNKNPMMYSRDYINYLNKILVEIDHESVARFINLILNCRNNGSSIYFIGNGGSAATCSHFANDLQIGTRSLNKPIRAISLADNMAIITAIANDYGYDEVFIQQIQMLAKPNDVVVGISASGNSSNLVKAFEYCKNNSIGTFALVAFDGGEMLSMADDAIHIKTELREYGPAEDAHMVLDHLVMTYISKYIKD